MVFHHNIDRANPITTFSISNVCKTASAVEVISLPKSVVFATAATGISKSQTHLHAINNIAKTWCTRDIVTGRPGIEYTLPETQSAFDQRIVPVCRCLTTGCRN
jgi:Tfp pilus assembly pilus retraction ATPase PilT